MSSADGKGRSLFDIMTGRNKRDTTPLELKYHNPLEAQIGTTFYFEHEPDISGINFSLEKIFVYETKIGREKFYHTDYHLKGMSLSTDGFIKINLRLIPDDNLTDKIGHRIQILYLYDEMYWDISLYDLLCDNGGHDPDYDDEGESSYKIYSDSEGNKLDQAIQYWRVEDVQDPYKSKCIVLSDEDGNGTVEDNELDHFPVTSWDFSRLTDDENGQEITEYLTIEMEDNNQYFTFLRGTEIKAFQVTVL